HEAHDYKITEFEQLITNMKYNVQNAKLFELFDHGLIQIDEADGGRGALERTIIGTDIQIGTLTITQLITSITSTSGITN
ncbi:MAG: hypothetical protein IJB97_06385, partial [Clostridia bacterium]|nr:hypothetical protein [Clostridia bacterium]